MLPTRRYFFLSLAVLALLTVIQPAFAVTNIGNNFQTITLTDISTNFSFLTTPPDTQADVGPNHVVSFTNGAIRVYGKDGNSAPAIQRDTTFWNTALANNGQPTLGGATTFDPRITFDPLSGRWFATELTSPATGNDILIARSNTSDPNGTWKAVRFTNTNNSGGALFADFDTLGIDANGVYVGTNNFTAGGSFANTALYSIPKADLVANSPTLANLTKLENLSGGTNGFTPHPTNNFSLAAGTELVVSTNTTSSFFVAPISGTTAAGATLGAAVNVNILNGNFASDAVQSNAAGTAASAVNIDAGDIRLSSAVQRVGNLIYTVRSVDVGGGTAEGIRFTVLNALTNTVVQDSTISDPGFFDYFPAVAANGSGDVLISFTRSGFAGNGSPNNRFPSAYAVVGSTSAGVVSFGPLQQLKLGNNEYLGAGGFDSTPPRWGDYSQASVDPTDPGIFWAAEEFSLTGTRWGTQSTELIPTKSGEIRWSATGLGSFGAPANWFNGVLPGNTEHAILSRPGAAYTVHVTADVTNDRLSVRQGTPTLLIDPGVTYTLTNSSATTPSLTIAEFLGTPTLTVVGGGTLQTVTTSIAAGVNGSPASNISQGTLTINGGGTVWNNSGDVFIGGSSTAAGGTGTLNVIGSGAANIGGTLKLWNDNSTVNVSSATLAVGGLNNPSGTNPGIILGNPPVGFALTVNGNFNSSFSGTITGTGSLRKSGTGTLTLTGNNSYFGTTINGGVLSAGSNTALGSGSVTVNAGGTLFVQSGITINRPINLNGGTLAGKGTVTANITIDNGSVLSPGASPGTLFGVNQTWGPLGNYLFEINNFGGMQGVDPGWDLMDLSGALSITATPANPFSINLTSLTLADAPGLAANFNPGAPFDLFFALSRGGPITGFNASNFVVNTAAFQNPTLGGTFTVVQGTSGGVPGLALHFQPAGVVATPEPAAICLWTIVAAFTGGWFFCRRK